MSQASLPKPCVFLDRDGVLNRAVVRNGKPYPPATLEEFEILPGVAEACTLLKGVGYLLVVVTNQPDVARGTTPLSFVQAINTRLKEALPLDAIKICAHDSADNCACRKPKPGMLLEAARENTIDLAKSFMVGDRWRDCEAGARAGCKTIFIDYGYDEPQPSADVPRAQSLLEAAHMIVAHAQG